MSAIKVEGSIGQLPHIPFKASDPETTESARFAQLMLHALAPAANRRVMSANRLPTLQRYRVVGGQFDGVECEVSENGQAISLCVIVPRHALYLALKALTAWLERQLQCPGYAVTLEIHYVKRGA